MKLLRAGLACIALTLFSAGQASAHTVSLSWNVLSNGDVEFFDQHWHGALGGPAGSLFVDGIEHAFTGVLNSTPTITGLEGALVNPTYATFAAGTLTALSNDDFLTVTVSGLAPGAHTFGTTTIALTRWAIPGAPGGTINVNIPNIPEPGTVALLGIGLTLFGLGRRRRV